MMPATRNLALVIEGDRRESENLAVILSGLSLRATLPRSVTAGLIQVTEEEPALIVMAEEVDRLRLSEVVPLCVQAGRGKAAEINQMVMSSTQMDDS
ncbi:MAG: hypothetical protein GTO22_05910 [Gemmatimonadales bacterium]|nr:hypothetical protein [Gemmatimonadales bacterium]